MVLFRPLSLRLIWSLKPKIFSVFLLNESDKYVPFVLLIFSASVILFFYLTDALFERNGIKATRMRKMWKIKTVYE